MWLLIFKLVSNVTELTALLSLALLSKSDALACLVGLGMAVALFLLDRIRELAMFNYLNSF
ncbi:hypothetical protein N644_0903 [Lactiplantibacillus paraplantarum]|nr:hypothetical protein N644_0903 [Lactiplantibacillus paraplantarum]